MKESKGGKEAVVFAEYRLLNALSKNPTFLEDSRIHAGLFIHETAKSVLEAIERLADQGIPITSASLFQTANEIDFSVSLGVIESIFSIDEQGASILDDILLLLEKAIRKHTLQDEIHKLSSSLNKDADDDTILQHLQRTQEIYLGLRNKTILQDIGAWTDQYLAELESRATGKKYPYGDPYLDSFILKGAYPGAITTIAAGTGQGKSTYVLNLINGMINMHVPSIYVSLEMSGIDTYDRLIALRRGIPIQDLYANDESLYSIIEMVKEEKKSLDTNKKFYFVEEPNLSIAQLRSVIKEFKQRSQSTYALVAIDLVTQLKDFMSSSGGMSVANAMEKGMNELNALAKEQNVHIIAVAQFNRDADNTKIHTIEDLDLLRPTLNHIKNSHSLAERSRVVISLFRKKFYSDRYLNHLPEAETIVDTAEITILKNSSGPVGKAFHYLFEGEIFTMTPYVEEESEAQELLRDAADY